MCFVARATLVEAKCSLSFLLLKRLHENIIAFTKKTKQKMNIVLYIRSILYSLSGKGITY